MGVKSVSQIAREYGLSRFTLAQAAKDGNLKGSAEKSEYIWLIDDSHEDFKKWLAAHQHQPRTKGEKKKKS